MDDRESLYFDTISLAESEAAAAIRKSLSQSRNTIYHSAVDLADNETPAKRASSLRLQNTGGKAAAPQWTPNYRHSYAMDHPYNSGAGAGGDYTDAAIAAQVAVLQNGRGNIAGSSPIIGIDDGPRRPLQGSLKNRDKKSPITYSQWKLKTRRRFDDHVRDVDFVLVYKEEGDSPQTREKIAKRNIFEANLIREGLHLEHNCTQRIHFIKLHTPDEVLERYAEILKIKLPLKRIPGQTQITADSEKSRSLCERLYSTIFGKLKLNPEKFAKREDSIYYEFSRNYKELFDTEQKNFFDPGCRNSIINFILERQRFIEGQETPDNMGIEKLLADGVYESAYPLHDDTDRSILLSEWANLRKWLHIQPLDSIKEYFGPKIALYFAWLGFYSSMLIPVSIFGVICFLYGVFTLSGDPISQEICDKNVTTIMCPQCDRNCDYWKLQDTCKSSKMNYIIDNKMTVVYAIVMSIWAVLYLELWKRYSATLVHRWGLTGFSQHVEHPRPQYLAKVRKSKYAKSKSYDGNEILYEEEAPWRARCVSRFTSYSIMMLFICISIIAISSMVVYRMAQKASHSILGNEDSMVYKVMVLPVTAGIIDLIIISLLDYAYSYLAVYLTDMEYCRTQNSYDESLTIKNYIFQFVNYYSSLFYIAFLKGKFVGYPAKYNRVLGFRQEECNPGGCLMELCIQLVIIMVGKQAINAIVEMLIPYLNRLIRKLYAQYKKNSSSEKEKDLVPHNQWTEDYHLEAWSNNSLFSEYLEMVLQYGFVTLFSLAFPLAPLLALINNVIEVRLDAKKMLCYLRRPIARRANNIGVWYQIMSILTKMSVAASAMIIAFSTNLIPKLVYTSAMGHDALDGYLNFTLAFFNTKDFQVTPILPNSPYGNITSCRYTEFRNPPWHENPYKRPLIYWRILTARLAFIVIFQNIIGVIQTIVQWAIADVPQRLWKRIKHEEFLSREHIIEYEKKRVAEEVKMNGTAKGSQQLQNVVVSKEEPKESDEVRRRYTPNVYEDDRTTPV